MSRRASGRPRPRCVARALVGIGEAAYGTIAPSLLADYYPRHTRSRVFGIFYAVIPLGAALGYLVAGQMDVHFGWRSAFFVAGAPGILLAVAALRLHDPPRGSQEGDRYQASGPPPPARPGGRRAPSPPLPKTPPSLPTGLGYAPSPSA